MKRYKGGRFAHSILVVKQAVARGGQVDRFQKSHGTGPKVKSRQWPSAHILDEIYTTHTRTSSISRIQKFRPSFSVIKKPPNPLVRRTDIQNLLTAVEMHQKQELKINYSTKPPPAVKNKNPFPPVP